MFNKPKGVVVTRSDELSRKTVYDLLPEFVFKDGWMPVGRLDMDSKGIILFTRDGHISESLTRPGTCTKVYELWVRGMVTEAHCRQVLDGIESQFGRLKVASIKLLGGSGPKTRIMVELNEGKNRHLRRLFGALKDPKFQTPLKVLELKRIQIGCIKLDVSSACWRFLTAKEEKSLLQCAKL